MRRLIKHKLGINKKAAFEWFNLVKKLASHFYRNKTSNNYSLFLYCRSPLGLRGLKYGVPAEKVERQRSQPSWAAWIEIEKGHFN